MFGEFSQNELNEKSQELSSKVIECQKVEDEKKSSNSAFKEVIDGIEARINELARDIRRKGADKQVNCVVKFHDPVPGMKTTIRLDTKETVKTEEMTSDEKQTELFDDIGSLEDLFAQPSEEKAADKPEEGEKS